MASLNTRNFPPGFPKQVGVYGTTKGGPPIVTMPTVAADLTTTDTFVFQLVVTNASGGALTITLKDKTGGTSIFNATSIANASTVVYDFPEGLFFDGGLNWVASGVITAAIVAFYK